MHMGHLAARYIATAQARNVEPSDPVPRQKTARRYSCRNTEAGSTRAARRVGKITAAVAAVSSTSTAAPNAIGSADPAGPPP